MRERKIDKHWVSDGAYTPCPYTMEEFQARVDKICGCSGRHDCDCVSVFNQARVELWTEGNERNRRQHTLTA